MYFFLSLANLRSFFLNATTGATKLKRKGPFYDLVLLMSSSLSVAIQLINPTRSLLFVKCLATYLQLATKFISARLHGPEAGKSQLI